jgi:hypothetical protein
MFQKMPDLKQILIFFQRPGDLVRRKRPTKESSRDMGKDYVKMFKTEVPRTHILYVPRDFGSALLPFRFFIANYDGLQLVLKRSRVKRLSPPLAFWSGSF